MAGLTHDVCIVFPAISGIEDGYEVQVVIDAGGSPTQAADETSTQRMKDHGVTLTTTNQLMAGLASKQFLCSVLFTRLFRSLLFRFTLEAPRSALESPFSIVSPSLTDRYLFFPIELPLVIKSVIEFSRTP